MIDELIKAYEQGKADYEKYRQTILNIIELLYSFCNTVLKRFLASPAGKRAPDLELYTCNDEICVNLELGLDEVEISITLEGEKEGIILLELKYSLDRGTIELKQRKKHIHETYLTYLAEQYENIKKLVIELAYRLGVLERYYEDRNL